MWIRIWRVSLLLVLQLLNLLSPVLEAFLNGMLKALVRWREIHSLLQRFRETTPIRQMCLEVMCVLIAFAIVQLLHELGRRVAQMQRNRLGQSVFHVLNPSAIGSIERI